MNEGFRKGQRVKYVEPAGGGFYMTLPLGAIGTVEREAFPGGRMVEVVFDDDHIWAGVRIMYASELRLDVGAAA